MDDLDPRLRAVCDLNVAEVREYSGRHEYDGVPQDLSRAGVAAGLARLAAARESGAPYPDLHDEAHLRAFEDLQRVVYGDLELHRRNPMFHLAELDLACYDKDYAPTDARDAARAAHLAAWPRVIDAAVESLDELTAPVAESLLGGIRGLAARCAARARTRQRGGRRSPRTRGWSGTSSRQPARATRTRPWGPPRWPRCWAPQRRWTSTWANSPRGRTPNGTG